MARAHSSQAKVEELALKTQGPGKCPMWCLALRRLRCEHDTDSAILEMYID
jgi:hypothetical protein